VVSPPLENVSTPAMSNPRPSELPIYVVADLQAPWFFH